MKSWLNILLCSLGFLILKPNLHAQQPAHFILGENELAGVSIYYLHQDEELNYWLATSEGLIKYDGYTFQKLECEGMMSSSVFNVIGDGKGTLYCLKSKWTAVSNSARFYEDFLPNP